MAETSSDSDLDELEWSLKNRKRVVGNLNSTEPSATFVLSSHKDTTDEVSFLNKNKKFEELKQKSDTIRTLSAKRLQRNERKKNKRLLKKALSDPHVKELVEKERECSLNSKQTQHKEEEDQWKEIKPFLNVNSHLQGPVSHGILGPKTELETIVDKSIEEGDFEKAELLSDTLANKEFASKICKAFSAKRSFELQESHRAEEKEKQRKKIRWMFEAKEKWQMKANM